MTVREYLACQVAGDRLRAFALLTDRALHWAFATGSLNPAAVDELATPIVVGDEIIVDVRIGDVRVFTDGRAWALVEIDGARPAAFVFVETGGRWRIDAIVDVPASPPTPMSR